MRDFLAAGGIFVMLLAAHGAVSRIDLEVAELDPPVTWTMELGRADSIEDVRLALLTDERECK